MTAQYEGSRVSVGLFHPGTQHSYFTAKALQAEDMLAWYATEIFYRADRLPYSALRHCPASLRALLEREARRRYDPDLDPRLVKTFGSWEWGETIARRMGLGPLSRRLNLIGNVAFARRVARLAAQTHPSLLWGFNGASCEAFRGARREGIPCVLDQTTCTLAYQRTLYEEEAHFAPPDWRPQISDLSSLDIADREMDWATAIVAGSAQVVDSLPERHRAKAIVCPYGVDGRFFEVVPRPRGPQFTVLYVGNITPNKGLYHLLEACARLRATIPLQLRLVGLLNVPARALAPYADFVDHVPNVPYAQVHTLYANCDAFALPSLQDGFGRVALEAAASGLPMVLSDHVGAAGLFAHGVSAMVHPIRDITAIADCLSALYHDRDRALALGEEARRVARIHTWERYGGQVRQIARHLANAS
ncbi:glycosyltransferase family 4 protein [bacterium]|nr:glycosyltransferase family 4 protein [bacterium]